MTSAIRWGGWSAPPLSRFTPGKGPVLIVLEAGWASGPVWTGAENLAPTGIRSPNLQTCSESLYRLSYRVPKNMEKVLQNFESKLLLYTQFVRHVDAYCLFCVDYCKLNNLFTLQRSCCCKSRVGLEVYAERCVQI